MPLNIIVTDAGRAAIVNAQNTGTAPVTISEVGFSAGPLVPTAASTALPGEIKRLSTLAGDVVANDTIHLSVTDASADVYVLRSFALYLADGTLFAIYGQTDPVLNKTAASVGLLAIDVIFADIAAAALTFGNTDFINPPATTERAGVVELATAAEAQAGIDALRALTPAGAKAAVLGWLLAQDGAGSGLDADLLDGQHGAWYADITGRLGFTPLNAATYTAADVCAKLLTVDGAGSGIDADLLDGQNGSYYADILARLGFTPANKAGDTFTGPITIGGAIPSLTFGAGGPFINSISINRLALGTDGSGIERIGIQNTGVVHIGGSRGLPPGSNLPGSGNVRIVATAPGGTCITAYDSQDFSALQFVRDVSGTATQVGLISCTIGGTSYNTTSDYRLKEDLRPIADPLAQLLRLKPVNFRWKSHNLRTDGFIAHELAMVAPYAVTGEKDAIDEAGAPVLQSIDPSKLVPLIVAGMQDLAQRLATVELATAEGARS